MMKTSSIVVGLALLALSAWAWWLAGSLEYAKPFGSVAFGLVMLALAIAAARGGAGSRRQLIGAAVITAAGLGWGLDGAREVLRPALLSRGLDGVRVSALIEAATVVLLTTHLVANLVSRIRTPSAA